MAARLEAPPGHLPRLHAQSPAAPALSEYLYTQPRRDGTWSYRRQGGAQPIASAAGEAAAIITGSLHAAGW